MPELPPEVTTTSQIYEHYVRNVKDWRRPHLGASQIGKPCERALWYQFRWCVAPDTQTNGRMLRLFNTGFREEDRIVSELRAIGITVIDKLPNGNQIHLQDPKCPHFSGSMDGVGHGFIEAPKALHVLEFKTASTKSFKLIQGKGVKEAKPEHYAQMQMYMHWTHNTTKPIKRAFYFVVCKETDEIHQERINYLLDFAETLTRKAYKIIQANTPPARIKGASEKHSACIFCDYKDLCINKTICAEVSCRTCAHSNITQLPVVEGRPKPIAGFKCDTKDIDFLMDRFCCCEDHIYIPDLTPFEFVEANEREGTITYLKPDGTYVINGPGHTSSTELKEMISGGSN